MMSEESQKWVVEKEKKTHREQQQQLLAERNKKMQLKKNKIKLNFDCINL